VDLVLVVIEYVHPSKTLVLLEKEGKHDLVERTPYTARHIEESIFEAARRLLEERFKIPPDMAVISHELMDTIDSAEKGEYFKGLMTMMRKYMIRVTVPQVGVEELSKVAMAAGSQKNAKIEYEWVTMDKSLGIFEQAKVGNQTPYDLGEKASIEELAEPVLPWTEKHVLDLFKMKNVQAPDLHFGMPVQDLVEKLNDGSLGLGFRHKDAQLICISEKVLLWAECPERGVIVERDRVPQGRGKEAASGIARYSLPFTSKLTNENAFQAGRRIASSYLDATSWVNTVIVEEASVEEIKAGGALARLRARENKSRKHCEHREYLVRAQVSPDEADEFF
jgi:hypothetical protein